MRSFARPTTRRGFVKITGAAGVVAGVSLSGVAPDPLLETAAAAAGAGPGRYDHGPYPLRSWPQLKRLDMGRPHRSKVALVERRDLRLGEALGERHDAGIDDPEREVRMPGLQLAAAGQIDARRRLGAVDPSEQIVEEDEPGLGGQPAAAPVVEHGEDEGRDDEILVGCRQQPRAALVIGVGAEPEGPGTVLRRPWERVVRPP